MAENKKLKPPSLSLTWLMLNAREDAEEEAPTPSPAPSAALFPTEPPPRIDRAALGMTEDESWTEAPWIGSPKPGEIPFDDSETAEERRVWEAAAVKAEELRAEDEATRASIAAKGCAELLGQFANTWDVEAGRRLADDWPTSRVRVEHMRDEKVHLRCAGVIRADDAPPAAKRLAMKILAHMTKLHPLVVLKERQCAISVGGGFVMDGDADTVADACWIMCEAARREYWGHLFELKCVYERIGAELFQLCCEIDGPEAPRSEAQERLAPKLFELSWRLREHRYSQGFVRLHNLDVRLSVLTAAISYMLDIRAYPDQEVHLDKNGQVLPFNPATRHRLDGPVSTVYPTGLDCAMRTLVGFCEIDLEKVESDEDDVAAHRRLSRCADAARTVRCTGPLNDDEIITVELLVLTAMKKQLDMDKFKATVRKSEEAAKKMANLHAFTEKLQQKDAEANAGATTPAPEPMDQSPG